MVFLLFYFFPFSLSICFSLTFFLHGSPLSWPILFKDQLKGDTKSGLDEWYDLFSLSKPNTLKMYLRVTKPPGHIFEVIYIKSTDCALSLPERALIIEGASNPIFHCLLVQYYWHRMQGMQLVAVCKWFTNIVLSYFLFKWKIFSNVCLQKKKEGNLTVLVCLTQMKSIFSF